MIHNLKMLASAFAVVLVMGIVVISSASAHYTFTSPVSNTTTTGTQVGNQELVIAGQTIKCTVAKYSSTVSGTEFTEVTIIPFYEGCSYAAGAKTVGVTVNECTYRMTGVTQASGHGTVHVVCAAGKVIEIHLTNFSGAETCTLTVASQTVSEGYTAVNNGEHVTITGTSTVKATPHGKAGCPLLISGKFTGITTLEGFKDGEAHGAASKVKIAVDS